MSQGLGEEDGWKDLTKDTNLKTMIGKLKGITIDDSGQVTEIDAAQLGLQGGYLEVTFWWPWSDS